MNDIEQKLKEIQFLAHDLTYTSETDSDVNAFLIGRNITKLTAESFSGANYFICADEVSELDFTEYMRVRVNIDSAWKPLADHLGNILTEPKVFITGEIERVIYVVGLYQGVILGVSFFGVAT